MIDLREKQANAKKVLDRVDQRPRGFLAKLPTVKPKPVEKIIKKKPKTKKSQEVMKPSDFLKMA